FHLNAPERTTPEFLAESSDAGVFEEEEERVLASLLRHCDRVKFAQYRPTSEEMRTSFTQVTDFVEGTIPERAGWIEKVQFDVFGTMKG
ncbi:MAG: hypothetical protein IIC55_10070, partial [Proteobacteria bacterium]|nr:hypothetical protein [Pseudomonadota bacterium]